MRKPTGVPLPRLIKYRNAFSGLWICRPERVTPKKAILISGTPRGGTSFTASSFLRLGVAFSRGEERETAKRTHDHRELRDAFRDQDEAAIKSITDEFSAAHDVWGWKLPTMLREIDMVARNVEHAHYAFVFKEPVSIAFRRVDIMGAEFLEAMGRTFDDYAQMLRFAETTEAPVLFISYETAMANLEAYLADVAAFCGITEYDPASVIAEIQADAENYYPGKKEGAADA